MAFNVQTLQTAFYNVFHNMTSGDITEFSDGIANAIVDFVSTGKVETIDAGTISAGVYAGKGEKQGGLSVQASGDAEDPGCADIIKSACEKMWTDRNSGDYGSDYLAEEIGKAVKKMADDGEVNTDVKGQVTPPGSSPQTLNGKAKGTITCSETALVAGLKKVFSDMWEDRNGEGYDGNLKFAEKLASEVNSFWTSGVINTQGQGELEGSVGVGSIS